MHRHNLSMFFIVFLSKSVRDMEDFRIGLGKLAILVVASINFVVCNFVCVYIAYWLFSPQLLYLSLFCCVSCPTEFD